MKKLQNIKEQEKWATFLVRLAMELRKNTKEKSIVVNGQYRMVA